MEIIYVKLWNVLKKCIAGGCSTIGFVKNNL